MKYSIHTFELIILRLRVPEITSANKEMMMLRFLKYGINIKSKSKSLWTMIICPLFLHEKNSITQFTSCMYLHQSRKMLRQLRINAHYKNKYEHTRKKKSKCISKFLPCKYYTPWSMNINISRQQKYFFFKQEKSRCLWGFLAFRACQNTWEEFSQYMEHLFCNQSENAPPQFVS